MRELLLIDLAMCAAVIVVTAAVMAMLRRRGSDHPRMPVEERRGAVAGLADEGMPGRGVADVPGFRQYATARDLGADVPAGPEQAADPPVSGVADAGLGSHGLGAEPDEPPAAAGAVTAGERIDACYEEAGRPVARYLAARGWTQEQMKPGRAADADAAAASGEAAAGPGGRRAGNWQPGPGGSAGPRRPGRTQCAVVSPATRVNTESPAIQPPAPPSGRRVPSSAPVHVQGSPLVLISGGRPRRATPAWLGSH
jgi:hypothetical protein